jgi:hypothetical protein
MDEGVETIDVAQNAKVDHVDKLRLRPGQLFLAHRRRSGETGLRDIADT